MWTFDTHDCFGGDLQTVCKHNGQFHWKGIPVYMYATIRTGIFLTCHLQIESSYLSTRPLKEWKEKVTQFQGRCLTDCVLGLRSLAFLLGKVFLLLHQQIVTKKAQTGSDFIIFNMNFMTLPPFWSKKSRFLLKSKEKLLEILVHNQSKEWNGFWEFWVCLILLITFSRLSLWPQNQDKKKVLPAQGRWACQSKLTSVDYVPANTEGEGDNSVTRLWLSMWGQCWIPI